MYTVVSVLLSGFILGIVAARITKDRLDGLLVGLVVFNTLLAIVAVVRAVHAS